MSKNICSRVAPRWSRFRFRTVEALCRDALSHSTPPFSSSFLMREVHCGKVLTPGGDAKSPWTARSIPQSPLSSRISPCASPASLLLHRKILFAQNLGIVPTTDSFTHPLPMLHKPTSPLFLRTLPQRVLAGLAHMDFARAKPRQNVGHHTLTSLYSALPCSFVALRHKLPSF